MRTAKTDLTGRMPRLIRVFAGRTSFCWFCHEAAQIITAMEYQDIKDTVSCFSERRNV